MSIDLQIAGRQFASVNPATGGTLGEFECATEPEVHEAVARAREAQSSWNDIGVRNRTAILRKFQRDLHQKKSEIAELITQESGKPCVEALLTEVLVALDAARFCIENAFCFLRDEQVPPLEPAGEMARDGVFGSGEELGQFLAHLCAARHAGLA